MRGRPGRGAKLAGPSVLTDELGILLGQPIGDQGHQDRCPRAAVVSTLPPAASTEAVMMVP